VTLDDVPGLHIVREKHRVVTNGTARLLDLGHRPDTVRFARPERQPRSVGSVEDIPTFDPGWDLDLLPTPFADRGRHCEPSSSAAAFDLRFPAASTGQPSPVHDLWHHVRKQAKLQTAGEYGKPDSIRQQCKGVGPLQNLPPLRLDPRRNGAELFRQKRTQDREHWPAPLPDAQQALKLPPVKAHDDLPINNGDGRGLVAKLQQILQSPLVSPDILRLEGNARLRKKLLLRVAAISARLRVHNNLFRHPLLHASVLLKPARQCFCRL